MWVKPFYFFVAIVTLETAPWTATIQDVADPNSDQREAEICSNEIDIVFLIDSSGSVQEKWNDIIDDAEILQANFHVHDNATRIAIIDISAVANVYKHLDSNNTNEETYQILETLRSRPQNGRTDAELGLEMVLKVAYSANPRRLKSKKVLVIYSDIAVQNGPIKDYFIYMASNHIDVFFIQVGEIPSTSDVMQMALYNLIDAYVLGQRNATGEIPIEQNICFGKNIPGSPGPVRSIVEKDESLYAHNKLRSLHGVPSLEWDEDLAKIANDWAYHLAVVNQGLAHSSMSTYSESIAMHYGGDSYHHSYETALLWYKTIKYYNFDNPGYNYLAGTFTQMVWKSTYKFGFGIAYRTDTKTTFTVATYAPKGNFYNKFEVNVPPPLAGLPPHIPDASWLILKAAKGNLTITSETGHKYGLDAKL